MSFCPTKDIHSIYLDGELPEDYKADYELHLKTCEACQKELSKLRNLHALLEADSNSISLSQQQLDQSFDKLMVKMNYSKNTKHSKKQFRSLRYIIPAAAAAAVVAVVVPMRLRNATPSVPVSTSSFTASALTPVPSATNVSVGGGNGVVISGNIHESVLPSAAASPRNAFSQSSNSAENGVEKTLFQDIDVFRPAFNEDKTISIKITVPGIDQVPVTTEIELPVSVNTGN